MTQLFRIIYYIFVAKKTVKKSNVAWKQLAKVWHKDKLANSRAQWQRRRLESVLCCVSERPWYRAHTLWLAPYLSIYKSVALLPHAHLMFNHFHIEKQILHIISIRLEDLKNFVFEAQKNFLGALCYFKRFFFDVHQNPAKQQKHSYPDTDPHESVHDRWRIQNNKFLLILWVFYFFTSCQASSHVSLLTVKEWPRPIAL